MYKSTSVLTLLLFTFAPQAFVYGNGLFSVQNNRLYVPYINYLGQNYQAEFSLLNNTQLQLISARPRAGKPTYGKSIIISEHLNFILQPINSNGQLYRAEISHFQGNTFNIKNISVVNHNDKTRGNLIGSTLVNQVSQAQFDFLITLYNLQNASTVDIKAHNDVLVYAVDYQTIDPSGAPVQTSALVAFPANTDNSHPLLAYQHGIEVLKDAAPSHNPNDMPTIALAASGYVVVSADYLGLGGSHLLHPFAHAHSLASSVIDGLRSVRQLAAEQDIKLNGQVFLIGYSEGGYATMAAHREIQLNYSEEFNVTASAPMGGPYALSTTMIQQITNDKPPVSPFHLPYGLLAYNQVYGITEQLNDFFQPPNDQLIIELYDGLHSSTEINAVLTDQQVYAQTLIDSLEVQNSWLKTALVENDIYRWIPDSPLYLFHCINDDRVPFLNTQIAYDYFQATDAAQVQLFAIDEPLLNQGDNIHKNCAIPLMQKGLAIFDSMVQ